MVQAFDDSRPRQLITPRTGGASTTGRVPPHNLEAEESVLGAMLLSRDAIAAAMENCKAEDFYKAFQLEAFDWVSLGTTKTALVYQFGTTPNATSGE